MRLAKSVKVVLGIAVSGGVAFVLSGSALAADGGTGTASEKVVTNVVQNVETTGTNVKGAENESALPVSSGTKKGAEAGPAAAGTVESKGNPVLSGQSQAVPAES